MTAASSLVPLWNRQAEWQLRLGMIDAAESFVYLTTFYIDYDEYGIALFAALERAQSRGVSVTLLIDTFGQRMGGVVMSDEQRTAIDGHLYALRARGAQVILYQPPRLAQRLIGGGHHVKIQLSEAGEALFASGNITKSSYEVWNEYAVALRGPVVCALLETIEALGAWVDKRHMEQVRGLSLTAEATIELEYWFCNPNSRQGYLGPLIWRARNSITDHLETMLHSAKESILITSFYFKPTEILMKAVLRAARRGVQVQIFHSHRDALPSTDLAWIAAATGYGRLLKAGVEIFENRHGEHSKIVLVDGKWAAFGSYNFEDAAHDRLAEAMLASHDARAIEPLRAIFAELRHHEDNTRVTHETLRALPFSERVRILRYGRFKWWM